MEVTLGGLDCTGCPLKNNCGGNRVTNGHPFGGACMLIRCCESKKFE